MQDICNSLEDAIRERVMTGGYPLNIYTGQGDYTKEAPYLIVHARQGDEFPLGSGNWNIQVLCGIEWPAEDEDLAGFRQLCTDVFGLLMADDLASLLSNAEGLTVLGIHGRQLESDTDGTQWQSVLMFTCYCFINDVVDA